MFRARLPDFAASTSHAHASLNLTNARERRDDPDARRIRASPVCLRMRCAIEALGMEALQAPIAGTLGFSGASGSRRLVIASDLLQHSEVLSFYRGEDWDDPRRLAGF